MLFSEEELDECTWVTSRNYRKAYFEDRKISWALAEEDWRLGEIMTNYILEK